MQRTTYRGAVRDTAAELERDSRMLALSETGLANAVIAQRMGVSVTSVRQRIKRALVQRERATAGAREPSGQAHDDAS